MSFINDDMDDDVLLDEELIDDDGEAEHDDDQAEPESTDERLSQEPEKESQEPEKSEKEPYGRKVQKRIDKLTREKRELENMVRQMQTKVESIEAKSTAREFSEFQQQISWSEQQVKSELNAARAEYRKATEEGDVEGQLAAQDKMFECREQLAEKRRLGEMASEQAKKFQQAPVQQPVQQPANQIDNLPDGTRSWLKQNRWYMDGSDPKAAAYAQQMDADLQEEGYSPEDTAMYAELDRRLAAAVPRMAKKSASTTTAPAQARTAPKAKVAGSSVDGQATTSSKTPSRRLTNQDLTTMRTYGFDPNNNDHRKAWIKRNDPL
jgi:hypothetical protein